MEKVKECFPEFISKCAGEGKVLEKTRQGHMFPCVRMCMYTCSYMDVAWEAVECGRQFRETEREKYICEESWRRKVRMREIHEKRGEGIGKVMGKL